ncbi:MAG TPA: hypothetical protein VGP06_16635 [Janthinobacterium sp.]|jgi:hypothetical protein|nr:hypothetical protein [Janthinobacterium sp.]
MRRFFLFLTSLCMALPALATRVPCGSGVSVRYLAGPEPLASELHSIAQQVSGVFFARGDFDEERFTYVGAVHTAGGKTWHVAFLHTVWGTSCRSTSRLLVFSSDKRFVGQYAGLAVRPFRVDADSIIFDTPADQGNRLTFTAEGPPLRAQFGGEHVDLSK